MAHYAFDHGICHFDLANTSFSAEERQRIEDLSAPVQLKG